MKKKDTVLRVAGPSPYDVVIGHDLSERLPQMLGVGVQRVAVVFSDALAELVRPVLDSLAAAYDVMVLPIPDGERAKKAAVAVSCWEALGEAGFTRSDALVTFGGGATTDVGGFVAATWLRGVKVVHVPTTLLGMVDAAVGGKTGINTRSGKNLVGAFHEPAGVLCDLATLRSLPRAELVAGLGEVVKCGFIADPEILALIEDNDPAAITAGLRGAARAGRAGGLGQGRRGRRRPQGDRRRRRATPAARCSTTATRWRTRSSAPRTTGSGTARPSRSGACTSPSWPAGPAPSTPRSSSGTTTRSRGSGLPTTYSKASFDDLHRAMKVDKKSRGSQLRFVVLSDIAVPTVLAGPSVADLRDAYAAIGGVAT